MFAIRDSFDFGGCACSVGRARRLIAPAASARRQSTLTLTRKCALTRRSGPCIFSSFRTLPRTRNLQHYCYPLLANSFTHRQSISLVFPVGSLLFLRSSAQERKSTPLVSCACALFWRNGGSRKHFGPFRSRRSAVSTQVRTQGGFAVTPGGLRMHGRLC